MLTAMRLPRCCTQDTYDQLAASAKVRVHIPAFVQRFSRQRLAALTSSRVGEVGLTDTNQSGRRPVQERDRRTRTLPAQTRVLHQAP